MIPTTLAGRRVLVVEDELAIAMLIETALEDEQCTVVGPCGNLADAMEAARGEVLDLAVLDINLAGEMAFPVGELLAARGVPFVVLSGYGDAVLSPERRDWPVCGKPFKLAKLIGLLTGLVR